MSRHRVRSAVVVVILLVAARSATAQQATAEIRGRVADQQMAALPGVTVTVTNQDSGTFRDVTCVLVPRQAFFTLLEAHPNRSIPHVGCSIAHTDDDPGGV